MKVGIIGSGGHARSVAGVAIEELNLNVLAFFDIQGTEVIQEKIYDVPVLPGKLDLENQLKKAGIDSLILAIGDSDLRQKLYLELKGKYFFPNIISKSAGVKKTVVMGDANIIFPFAYVGPYTVLADNNIINTRATIEHECKIGSSNHFSPSSTLLGRVTVGNLNFICGGATVIPGLKIENKVILAANSTATHDLIKPGTYVGSPAKSRELV